MRLTDHLDRLNIALLALLGAAVLAVLGVGCANPGGKSTRCEQATTALDEATELADQQVEERLERREFMLSTSAEANLASPAFRKAIYLIVQNPECFPPGLVANAQGWADLF